MRSTTVVRLRSIASSGEGTVRATSAGAASAVTTFGLGSAALAEGARSPSIPVVTAATATSNVQRLIARILASPRTVVEKVRAGIAAPPGRHRAKTLR